MRERLSTRRSTRGFAVAAAVVLCLSAMHSASALAADGGTHWCSGSSGAYGWISATANATASTKPPGSIKAYWISSGGPYLRVAADDSGNSITGGGLWNIVTTPGTYVKGVPTCKTTG